MNNWGGLDFFIFLIFAVNTIHGMTRGATKEIISIMGLSIALIFAIKFTIPLAAFFNSSPMINEIIASTYVQNFMTAIGADPLTNNSLYDIFFSLSLLVCFVGAYSVCQAALLFPGFVEVFSFPYAALNRKVGAALGCTRGYIFNVILILILALHLVKSSNMLSGSYFVNLFLPAANKFNAIIIEQAPERYKEIYQDKNLYNEKNITDTVSDQPQMPNPSTAAPQNTPTNPPSNFMAPQQQAAPAQQ